MQTLSWSFEHQQAGADTGDSAVSFASGPDFTFTALVDLIYTLSGSYSLTGQGKIEMITELREQPANIDLFLNDQRSNSTPNENFVLGGTGGDSLNVLTGNDGAAQQRRA